jgi:spermidine synthase
MTLPASWRLPFLATLLGLSGACALIYQTAWLREFRLFFGGATPATAAVLAIFMAGLGVGGALLGRRVESAPNPLRMYGLIELGVGVSALLTPLLLSVVRTLYSGTGGIAALGLAPATVLQLVLAALVLAVPCLLMGGSLPAAFKWVETEGDVQRGALGVLYGVNTLGALVGVLLSTFWLLEHWGIHATLFAAAAVNLLIGGTAWWVARGQASSVAVDAPAARPATPAQASAKPGTKAARVPAAGDDAASELKAPPWFVYLAAGITGFAFFLMELVWYRMLAPLMGSSVYGFGLILALALAGIGLGGLLYRWGWASRAGAVSLWALALVSAWQAVLLALPWLLGDNIAVFAYHMNQLRGLGLAGLVTGWALVAGLLVCGPALLAGVQFPLLVGLLGEGSRNAGRHVGYAYAANTLGAIVGLLLGGFVLLPWLTAPGCWRLVVLLTIGLSVGAVMLAKSAPRGSMWVTAPLWVVAVWMTLLAGGPTAAWRHSPIGYGRIAALPASINGLRQWQNVVRGSVLRENEGREASVAVTIGDGGSALMVNGKSDGTAFGDADTQVMLGVLPALLHPQPRTALMVGLGTGTSAGWLADVPGMERVDVVEIEPGMARLARDFFAPVNRNVMDKANVKVQVGDAREALETDGPAYDLILSEPSNPYRAGVATLFTKEYYAAAKRRLAPGGVFGQWLQGYEVDSQAVQQVYATLASEFPYVETWATGPGDLLFISYLTPPAYPMAQLRERIKQQPFAEAIQRIWLTSSAEGVLAHHLASPAVAQAVAGDTLPNTDDRNRLEYGFARALSQDNSFNVDQVLSLALASRADLPAHLANEVAPDRLQLERLLMMAANNTNFTVPPGLQGDDRQRAQAIQAFLERRYSDVLRLWVGPAASPMEALLLQESAAQVATPEAVEQVRPLIGSILDDWPADAHFAAAQIAARNGAPQSVEQLREGFTALRQQVWSRQSAVEAALSLVPRLAAGKPETASMFLELLREPFPGGLAEYGRRNALAGIGPDLPPEQQLEVAGMLDPYPGWTLAFLEFRRDAYRQANDPRAAAAERDLQDFLGHADLPLQGAAPTTP